MMVDLSIKQCPICRKLVHYTTEDGRCEECIGKEADYYADNGQGWIIVRAKSLWSAKYEAGVHLGQYIINLRLATPEEAARFREEMNDAAT